MGINSRKLEYLKKDKHYRMDYLAISNASIETTARSSSFSADIGFLKKNISRDISTTRKSVINIGDFSNITGKTLGIGSYSLHEVDSVDDDFMPSMTLAVSAPGKSGVEHYAAGGYIISAAHSTTHDIRNAFNKLTTGDPFTSSSETYNYIQIEFPSATCFTGYAFYCGSSVNLFPKSWNVECSMDGDVWYNIDTKIGKNANASSWHDYETNLISYTKFIRFKIVDNQNGDGGSAFTTTITEIEIKTATISEVFAGELNESIVSGGNSILKRVIVDSTMSRAIDITKIRSAGAGLLALTVTGHGFTVDTKIKMLNSQYSGNKVARVLDTNTLLVSASFISEEESAKFFTL